MGPCVVFGEDVSVERVIFNGHLEMAHIHGNDVPDVGRGSVLSDAWCRASRAHSASDAS